MYVCVLLSVWSWHMVRVIQCSYNLLVIYLIRPALLILLCSSVFHYLGHLVIQCLWINWGLPFISICS